MYLFNTRIDNAQRLEKTLIAHHQTVNWLEQQVSTFVKQKDPFYALIVGARGLGKTHLISVIQSRISKQKNLAIAYLSEDEMGVDSYFDLLLRIFKAIKRSKNDERVSSLLDEKIKLLQTTEERYRVSYAEQYLLDFLKEQPLLVLLENMQQVFKGLKGEGQSKWRDFIQKYDNVSVIATSRNLFADIQKNDRPFFSFFNITHLSPLSFDQVKSLLLAFAKLEKRTDLTKHLHSQKSLAQLDSLYLIFGGNPRHWLAFFETVKTNFKNQKSNPFLSTVDMLNPYFEGFLRKLAPQQQKIIQYLAILRAAQTGKQIAQNTFLNTTTVSKQLSELQRLSFIVSYKEGRTSYYELTEPVLRITLELNEGQSKPTGQFLNFIEPVFQKEGNSDFNWTKASSTASNEFRSNPNLANLSSGPKRRKSESIPIQMIQSLIKKVDRLGIERLSKERKFGEAYAARAYMLLMNLAKAEFFKTCIEKELLEKWSKKVGLRPAQLFNVIVLLNLRQLKGKKATPVVENFLLLKKKYGNRVAFQKPLKFLEVGIAYFVERNTKALYQLAREERVAFQRLIA